MTYSRHRTTLRVAAALSLTFVLLIAGCGSSVTGVYKATDPSGQGSMAIELKGDGTATMTIAGEGFSDTTSGTYTVDGDNVTLKFQGETNTVPVKDGTLTIQGMGDTIVLKKQ